MNDVEVKTQVADTPALTITQAPVSTDVGLAPSTLAPIPATSMPGIGTTMTSDRDGMSLLYVPAGDFKMGSDEEHTADDQSPSYYDNHPQHPVSLDAFWIDQTEVSNQQYALCVKDGSCIQPTDTKSPTRSSYYDDPLFSNYPVIYIEWDMAKAYCEWAGRRLPTEAEWEKAARGTDARIYPWGNQPPNDQLLNYNSPSRDTTEVRKYPEGQSPYGAYDMAGNVWEWVADWYEEGYYQDAPASNPMGPDSVDEIGNTRALRGGSWFYQEGSSRSIFRFGVVPVDYLVRSDARGWSERYYKDTSIYGKPPYGLGTVGFRCAMDATP